MAGLFMLILAPIAALLIQMAISRTREYAADAAAAKYIGDLVPAHPHERLAGA